MRAKKLLIPALATFIAFAPLKPLKKAMGYTLQPPEVVNRLEKRFNCFYVSNVNPALEILRQYYEHPQKYASLLASEVLSPHTRIVLSRFDELARYRGWPSISTILGSYMYSSQKLSYSASYGVFANNFLEMVVSDPSILPYIIYLMGGKDYVYADILASFVFSPCPNVLPGCKYPNPDVEACEANFKCFKAFRQFILNAEKTGNFTPLYSRRLFTDQSIFDFLEAFTYLGLYKSPYASQAFVYILNHDSNKIREAVPKEELEKWLYSYVKRTCVLIPPIWAQPPKLHKTLMEVNEIFKQLYFNMKKAYKEKYGVDLKP